MHHILFVDDNEAICHIFARFFELHHFRVSTAVDPHAALVAYRNDPADGIVTDFRLIGMSGYELIQKVRDIQPNLPAIIVSGYTNEITEVDGHTPIFAKPVSPTLLVEQMSKMLNDIEQAD